MIAAGAADEVNDIFLETEVTVSFEKSEEKTKIDIHIAVMKINDMNRAMPALEGM